MRCCNPKKLAGTNTRGLVSAATASKRRRTVARNSLTGARAKKPRVGQSVATKPSTDWASLADELNALLGSTALSVRALPADGNCFYHAVAHRLQALGHAYGALQLKAIAGAQANDEAEEEHIATLVAKPVPLYLKAVPVEMSVSPLALNWDAAVTKGDPSAPALTLVNWTSSGVGKHFDILEFKRPQGTEPPDRATRASAPHAASAASSSLAGSKALGGSKRKAASVDTPRKLFKLEGGKVIRIRDGKHCGTARSSLCT